MSEGSTYHCPRRLGVEGSEEAMACLEKHDIVRP